MSDNKLLTEGTVRRFMKLANVNSLTDNFINEKYKSEDETTVQNESDEAEETIEEQDEETIEEPMEEEEPAAEEGEPELDNDDMLDDDEDMDMGDEDMDMGEEPGAADISLTEEEAQLLIDLGERLSSAMDEDEDMGDEDDDMEVDMGDEEAMDAPGEDEPASYGLDSTMQEAVVKEVLRRVTKRIVSEKMKRR